MFLLQKSKRKGSSKRQINIQSIENDILVLPGNEYRMILEVSAINFELKSEAEQDVLIDTYESFLNSLPCPVQIVVRCREIDKRKYLQDIQEQKSREENTIYKNQLDNYGEFLRVLIEKNKILSRNFYIILPYHSKETDLKAGKDHLTLFHDIVSKGLLRLGIRTRQLQSLEIVDLFYSFYNPLKAKQQPLTVDILKSINNIYIRGVLND